MVTTRGDMEARLEEIERAREEDRRKIDVVLESVQQLSNSLQALQEAPRPPRRIPPHRRDGYQGNDGSFCPRRHFGRNNSGQFRRSEPFRRHDKHDFLDTRDDAIKGQMEELIKSMGNILQTVRQLRNSFQSLQGIPKKVEELHNPVQEINRSDFQGFERDQGSVSGYAGHGGSYHTVGGLWHNMDQNWRNKNSTESPWENSDAVFEEEKKVCDIPTLRPTEPSPKSPLSGDLEDAAMKERLVVTPSLHPVWVTSEKKKSTTGFLKLGQSLGLKKSHTHMRLFKPNKFEALFLFDVGYFQLLSKIIIKLTKSDQTGSKGHGNGSQFGSLSFKQWDPGKFIVHLEDKVIV